MRTKSLRHKKDFRDHARPGLGLPVNRPPHGHNLGRAPRHPDRRSSTVEPSAASGSSAPSVAPAPVAPAPPVSSAPDTEAEARTGGAALVECLAAHDVPLWTCVPGESFLPVLDALWEAGLAVINTRHEAAAA